MAKGFENMEVWLDSPLAIEATRIFDEQTRECFDEETLALMDAGINPLQFDGLRLAITSDESKLINEDPAPKVILSASGMCDAGRIRHHLKHNLWRSDSTIVFAGYQGRRYPWTQPAGRCKGRPSVRRRNSCRRAVSAGLTASPAMQTGKGCSAGFRPLRKSHRRSLSYMAKT